MSALPEEIWSIFDPKCVATVLTALFNVWVSIFYTIGLITVTTLPSAKTSRGVPPKIKGLRRRVVLQVSLNISLIHPQLATAAVSFIEEKGLISYSRG